MNGRGLVIGLTGATGYIGGLLLERLARRPDVREIRSVARRPLGPPPGWGPGGRRFRHVVSDLSAPAAREAFNGVDILYHLAAQVWLGRPWAPNEAMEDMHRANVVGTANLARSQVGAAVLASTAAVYGAWPGNDLPLDEGALARPNPECPYAQHKLVAEKLWSEVEGPWAVARLCAVVGPHADARVAKAVRGYRLVVPAVRGSEQALQWMDEQDAVEGLVSLGAALLEGRPGVAGEVHNLATEDWLGAGDVSRLAGGRVVRLRLPSLLRAAELGRLAGVAPFGQDRAVLVNGPLAISPAKARARLGWRAMKSSAQVLSAALDRNWRDAPRNRPS